MLIEEPEATNDVIRNLDYVKVKIGENDYSISDLSEPEIRNVLSHCTDEQLQQVVNELGISFESVISSFTNVVTYSEDRNYQFIYAVILAVSLRQFGNTMNIVLPDDYYNFEEEPKETEETTDEIKDNVP